MPLMLRNASLPTLVLVASAAWMIATPLHAAGSACDAVYDAGIKQVQTPHHTHTTITSAATGKVSTSEGLFADGVEYSRLRDGAWQRSRMTHEHSLAKAQAKRSQSSADTCKNLGNDAGAGTVATMYSVHSDDAGTDSKVWLSATGLILRQTFTLPNGESFDSRTDYENVQAPAGVK